MKWSKTSVAVVVLTLTIGAILPSTAPPARGSNQTWAPYGPQINQIRFQFYGDPTSEASAFLTGQLDLVDLAAAPFPSCPPICSTIPAIATNGDFNQAPPQPSASYRGIYFNYASSTWAKWGCDFQHGNSPCGTEIRQALAHLIDKSQFIRDSSLAGGATPISDDLPLTTIAPNGTTVATTLTAQCQWDTLWLANSINSGYSSKYPCLGAFHLATDPGGFAVPGSPDFCAAVDHLIMATTDAPGLGLQRDPSSPVDAFGNHCGINPASPGLANIVAHPMRAIIRSTDSPRQQLGMQFINTVNTLFGGNMVNQLVGQWPHVLSFCSPFYAIDCWDWYTFGSLDGSAFPNTVLYNTYDSQFAPPPCASLQFCISSSNPTSVEIPSLDSALQAGVSTSDAQTAFNDVSTALNIMGNHAQDLPLYNLEFSTIALRSVGNPVDLVGTGFSNFWTYLYASKSNYTPFNPMYAFDGGGDPQTIRSGQSGGDIFSTVNPYFAQWTWEFNVINEVYDSLFQANPTVPTQVFCWMCDSYTQSVDSNGNTHYLVELRQTLRWQDGVPVDAYDVKFSLLTLRDLSAVAGGGASSVLDVKVLGHGLLDIVVQGQSIDQLSNLSSVPIIPRHIWELPGDHTYGDVGTVDPAKLDPSYDPIASGTFIGSGPFMCSSVFSEDLGRVGTGCVTNPGGSRGSSAIPSGATAVLTRFDRTSEPGNTDPFLQWFRNYNANWGTGSGTAAFSGQFQEFSWADRFDNAQVTTQDLASVAACYGKSSPSGCADYSYWLTPAFHPLTPNTISTEVAVVASHLDDSWVYPFSWTGNQTIQPGPQIVNIVPYNS